MSTPNNAPDSPQHQPSEAAYPELLRDLAHTVARLVKDAGVDDARASAIGETTAEELSGLYGGQVIYFPKAAQAKAHRRWQRIWERFTGDNHAELAREFGMGVHGVYRAIAVMRAEHRKRTQHDLFAKPAGEDDGASGDAN